MHATLFALHFTATNEIKYSRFVSIAFRAVSKCYSCLVRWSVGYMVNYRWICQQNLMQ